MKSYFAKLADRATLGNAFDSSVITPKRLSVEEQRDEELAEQEIGLLTETTQTRHLPTSVERNLPRADREQSVPSSFPDPLAVPPHVNYEEVRPVRMAPDLFEPTTEVQPTFSDEIYSIVPDIPIKTTPSTSVVNVEPRKTDRKEQPTNNEGSVVDSVRLAAVERDQAELMRRADLFMNSLLNHQPPPIDRPQETKAANKVDDRGSQAHPAATLAPKSATRKETEQSETSSLVIGKLTVEVTPTVPQPVPQSKVIVVREGGRGRDVGHSSRRFGIGQF